MFKFLEELALCVSKEGDFQYSHKTYIRVPFHCLGELTSGYSRIPYYKVLFIWKKEVCQVFVKTS